jgi:hypothetical protein
MRAALVMWRVWQACPLCSQESLFLTTIMLFPPFLQVVLCKAGLLMWAPLLFLLAPALPAGVCGQPALAMEGMSGAANRLFLPLDPPRFPAGCVAPVTFRDCWHVCDAQERVVGRRGAGWALLDSQSRPHLLSLLAAVAYDTHRQQGAVTNQQINEAAVRIIDLWHECVRVWAQRYISGRWGGRAAGPGKRRSLYSIMLCSLRTTS